MDPYKLLDLPRTFNYEMLRDQYKKMALKTHPDRSGLKSDYLFKLVTAAYKSLLVELKLRVEDPGFDTMKQSSRAYTREQSSEQASGSGFNLDRFNTVFSDNKMEDVYDTGYGHFMAESSPAREDIDINNSVGNFDNNRFNKAFDKLPVSKDKKVIIFKEPEALPSSKGIAFSELGVTTIHDFSGENLSNKNLQFSDYKKAHTTSRLVDPRTLKERKEYSSVKDLEADRGNISYRLSAKDEREISKKRAKEEAAEKKRKEHIKQHDKMVALQHERLNRLLLGR